MTILYFPKLQLFHDLTATVPPNHRSHDDGKKLIKTLSWTGNLAASPHIESQGRHCRLSCPANPSHHRPTLPSNNKRRIGDPAKYVAASTIMAMPDRWESYSSSYLSIYNKHPSSKLKLPQSHRSSCGSDGGRKVSKRRDRRHDGQKRS